MFDMVFNIFFGDGSFGFGQFQTFVFTELGFGLENGGGFENEFFVFAGGNDFHFGTGHGFQTFFGDRLSVSRRHHDFNGFFQDGAFADFLFQNEFGNFTFTETGDIDLFGDFQIRLVDGFGNGFLVNGDRQFGLIDNVSFYFVLHLIAPLYKKIICYSAPSRRFRGAGKRRGILPNGSASVPDHRIGIRIHFNDIYGLFYHANKQKSREKQKN